MRSERLLLPVIAVVLVAGCAGGNDESSGDLGPAEGDPNLIAVQYVDVVAPVASDCMGAGAREVPPASFDVPEGAKWLRLEGTFPAGRVALEVTSDDGRRVGYAAGATPVVVMVDEATLGGTAQVRVKAFACEGTGETNVRVLATFRRAPP